MKLLLKERIKRFSSLFKKKEQTQPLVVKQRVTRKLLGVPLILVLALLGIGMVTAGVVLSTKSGTITLTRPAIVSSLPSALPANAGDFYSFGLNYTNPSNQPQNYTLAYSVSHPSFVSGDVKIRILDNTSAVIAQSAAVAGGSINISDTNRFLQVGELWQGTLTIEFNISAPNATYTQTAQLFGGDDQFR